ncbi:hypothetical protein POM88_018062 [Heracleum sosnowskyi]|uniref:Helitron helicase-like domain-containing protein n=1 Tax=Heracleum sosnowskyi TaxID=360622 RepID=A0AAD8MYJ6_9APIA|nr:hypothetical protein POM88_018062 [Heracleum sosnowskyi]
MYPANLLFLYLKCVLYELIFKTLWLTVALTTCPEKNWAGVVPGCVVVSNLSSYDCVRVLVIFNPSASIIVIWEIRNRSSILGWGLDPIVVVRLRRWSLCVLLIFEPSGSLVVIWGLRNCGGMAEQDGPPAIPVKDGDAPTRRRGRPRIPVTEEVLERRSFSRQRVNVSRPKNTDGDAPPRKRGRPPNPVTEQVLEQRRLSRQRVNASRPKREGPSRKPGRPGRAMEKVNVDPQGVSTPTASCGQGRASTETSGAVLASQGIPPTHPPQENTTATGSRNVPPADLNMPTELALVAGVAIPMRKRGRPPIAVNDEVLEQRRLSRQKVNASRPKKQGPSTKRGRPRRLGTILEAQGTASGSTNQLHIAPGTPRQPNSFKENQASGASNVLADKDQNTSSAQENQATGASNVLATKYQNTSSAQDREPTIVGEDENMATVSNTGGTEIGESRRMRSSINQRKKEFMEGNTILDLGKQEETCGFCRALVWGAEFTGRHVGTGPKGYSICCGKGKVQLPQLRVPPSELDDLISSRGTRSTRFFNKSRVYNNLFAFCSFGGNVDHSVNSGKGPYVFRVSGRTYHSLGCLVPPDGLSPKFAQLYMYDAHEALTHRVNFPGRLGEVDPAIVSMLQEMLERDNALVAMFKQLRERFTGMHPEPVGLRLLERRTTDGRLENLPTANDYEFAGLVVDNDFTNCRDVVAEHKKRGLQHINSSGSQRNNTVNLFITFTCNPKWDEIQGAVQSSGSHDASVRPDLVARVFKMKFDAMMNDLTKKHVLGRVLAVVYTVEFQKRGLPHAHIVLWLGTADKLLTVDDIDNVISAEIPDKVADPITGM